MTTAIAVLLDDGIFIAADTKVSAGNLTYPEKESKILSHTLLPIYILHSGRLRNIRLINSLFKNYNFEDNNEPDEELDNFFKVLRKKFEELSINKDEYGQQIVCYKTKNKWKIYTVRDFIVENSPKYAAIGSGEEYAYSTIALANKIKDKISTSYINLLKQAIETAIELDINSDGLNIVIENN